MTTTMTTMTMFERKLTDSVRLTNGDSKYAVIQDEKPGSIWRKLRINEWTFSLSLFVFSFSIVLGKLYANYGNLLSWQTGDQYSLPSVTQMYDTIGMPILSKLDMKRLPANNERFSNTTNQYAEVAADTLTFCGKYGWLLKATMSGFVITSFTWFIVYKDSSIPGVDPPSPFSPSKRRKYEGSRIQMNYLVGMLNGILFFIYMCL